MIRVYLAGPITKPDPLTNALRAIKVADVLLRLGFAPYVPQLSVFWQQHGEYDPDNSHEDYETFMAIDFEWLGQCHALLRLPGHSPGADREEVFAKHLGIPVVHSVIELCTRFRRRH